MTPYYWALLAAVFWGLAPLSEKFGLRGGVDPIVGVFIRSLGVFVGVLCFVPFLSHLWGPLTSAPFRTWALLGGGGILASILGQLCFYRALQAGEMSRVVPIGAAYPALAFLLGVLIFKEPITLSRLVGVTLILAGTLLLR
jgi:bacterial/archaeal transporter family protein